MRTKTLGTVVGLALSAGVCAQAAVSDMPIAQIAGYVPKQPLIYNVQYRSPETRARDQEMALRLSYSDRRRIQADLKGLGFDPGPVDGFFGRLTRRAIWDWQHSRNDWASGYLTREQVTQLRAAARGSQPNRYSESEDRRFWDQTGASWGNKDGMRRYLERYPKGIYADYARDRLGRTNTQPRSRDDETWREVEKLNTHRGYRYYLDQYPNGRHADTARLRLNQLKAGAERRAWDDAQRADTIWAYRAFLDKHPESVYSQRARQRIQEIRDRGQAPSHPADEIAFNNARDVNTIAAYRTFLRDYPNSRFAPQARRTLESLTKGQARPQRTLVDLQAEERSILKRDQDVKVLLDGLRKLGYLKTRTDTTVTPEVRNAIRRLQKKIKKPVTGYVDKYVWSVIATVSIQR